MSFQNCRLRNTYLCESLKTPLSVEPTKVNMLKCLKHCNIQDSRWITLVHHPGKFSVAKSLS